MNFFGKTVKFIRLRSLLLLGKARGLYTASAFGIKRGYRHRYKSVYFDDRELKDEYQNEVYQLAKFYAASMSYKKIVDIGCGSGYKLVKYFDDYSTVGMEVDKTYDFLISKYPGKTWVKADDKSNQPVSADIIICADVIEHVENPDELLQQIDKIDFELLFLSTPERDLIRGKVDYGPPDNEAHIREWNSAEFYHYVSGHFQIISHQITNIEQATQLIICRRKPK